MSENTTELSKDADFEPVESGASSAKSGTMAKSVVNVLLILLLVGGAIYWLYDRQQELRLQIEKKIQQIDSKTTEVVSEIKETTSSVTESSSSLQSSLAELKARVEELANGQKVLSESLDVIQNQKPKQETDWVLAEVEYLLTVAQQRISLERDVTTALKALEAADAKLRDLGNPNLNPIREQLIKEMNALRGVEDADISGIVLYLSDVTSRVESLPLKDFEVPTLKDMKKMAGKEETSSRSWKEVLLAMWDDLVKLVEIKDQEVPDEILFDPELRYFLQQNLQLELTSAKLSALQRDTGGMKASLTRVSEILKRYFDVEAASVKSILEELDRLQKLDLKPPMPVITKSLNMLKAYRKAAGQEDQSS